MKLIIIGELSLFFHDFWVFQTFPGGNTFVANQPSKKDMKKSEMKLLKLFLYSVFILRPNATLFSQDSSAKNTTEALQLEASYIGDNINNLSGGIKTGSSYLGMATIRLGFDSEGAGLWKGGFFYINAANTHGASPSAEMLGDMQVVSNIEAGNHTYIQELWIRQTFGKVDITAGLQDLNIEFANSEYGALFLNSSFGILPVISTNIPAPVFPLTAIGLTAKWNITGNTSWLTAIYDGKPTEFDYNPYNVKWEFVSGDGILAITEWQYSTVIKQLPGIYKFGMYTHNHLIESKFDAGFPDSLNHWTFGAYVYADQKIWQQNKKSMGVFAQLGYSPSRTSSISSYIGLGINLTGMLKKFPNDILGLAVAHENLTGNMGSETSIELTFYKQINSIIFIQPDFQYIINPSGKYSNLDNCFAGTLRVGLSF